VAVLVDLVLPIQYPEAGSRVGERPMGIHIMALVTIHLSGIHMATRIMARVMPLLMDIPTVTREAGDQHGMALKRRRRRYIPRLL
jgi:hypothetical protein